MTQAPPESPFSLKRQLEIARFERALEVSESMAEHRVLLTTLELERLNCILTGRAAPGTTPNPQQDPWRKAPVTITLPSGKTETLSILRDPKVTVREKLHQATELAESGRVIDAAVEIYVALVLSHVFEDANRRIAVLAAHYFLKRYGVPLSGLALHEIGLGDLREAGQVEALRQTIEQMARFTAQK
jgi:prophage maintenance system killer protein